MESSYGDGVIGFVIELIGASSGDGWRIVCRSMSLARDGIASRGEGLMRGFAASGILASESIYNTYCEVMFMG